MATDAEIDAAVGDRVVGGRRVVLSIEEKRAIYAEWEANGLAKSSQAHIEESANQMVSSPEWQSIIDIIYELTQTQSPPLTRNDIALKLKEAIKTRIGG